MRSAKGVQFGILLTNFSKKPDALQTHNCIFIDTSIRKCIGEANSVDRLKPTVEVNTDAWKEKEISECKLGIT